MNRLKAYIFVSHVPKLYEYKYKSYHWFMYDKKLIVNHWIKVGWN